MPACQTTDVCLINCIARRERCPMMIILIVFVVVCAGELRFDVLETYHTARQSLST
jgi:hypothetical protein